jgi:hypothetical protein
MNPSDPGGERMAMKKILVAFDSQCQSQRSGDFVVPIRDGETALFWGLKSKKPSRHGMVVFVGQELGARDLFARLVDTGRKISSVDQCLNDLEIYLRCVSTIRLGDVLAIERQGSDLVLVPTGLRPETETVPIPD